jgi:hypothetical protein
MNMSKSSEVKLENMPIVDSQGNVYVLSVFSDAVYKFTADGQFIMSFGRCSSELDDLDDANAFAVDRMGNVYIVDSDQIRFFLPDGRFVRRFDVDSLFAEAPEMADAWTATASVANLWTTGALVA